MARPCHAQTGRASPLCRDINLLSYRKRIVDLDPEIPNGALDFCMAEQHLNGPQLTEAAAAVGCRLDFSALLLHNVHHISVP